MQRLVFFSIVITTTANTATSTTFVVITTTIISNNSDSGFSSNRQLTPGNLDDVKSATGLCCLEGNAGYSCDLRPVSTQDLVAIS